MHHLHALIAKKRTCHWGDEDGHVQRDEGWPARQWQRAEASDKEIIERLNETLAKLNETIDRMQLRSSASAINNRASASDNRDSPRGSRVHRESASPA